MVSKFQKAVSEKATKAEAVERPAMRPAMREDDPRARAAARAAQLREHVGDLDEGRGHGLFAAKAAFLGDELTVADVLGAGAAGEDQRNRGVRGAVTCGEFGE